MEDSDALDKPSPERKGKDRCDSSLTELASQISSTGVSSGEGALKRMKLADVSGALSVTHFSSMEDSDALDKPSPERKGKDRCDSSLTELASQISSTGVSSGEGASKRMKLADVSELPEEGRVYGRAEDVERLIQALLSVDSSSGDNISLIRITGKAGVGKTTLARLVYHDQRVRQHFDRMLWVHDCRFFEIYKIMRSIIEGITEKPCSEIKEHAVKEVLKEKLKGKRFMLVLDDVQKNVGKQEWEALQSCLIGTKECGVIVTAEDLFNVRCIGTCPNYQLHCLSEPASWSLFEQCAFDSQDPTPDMKLLEIGRKIVMKCQGLPSAVKTLGCALRDETVEKKWLYVLHSERWTYGSPISAALDISHDLMPAYLKPFFSCLRSSYGRGGTFTEAIFVRLWMEKCRIPPHVMKTAESIGSGYFDELRRRSFFQYAHSDAGGDKRFTLHCPEYMLSLKDEDTVHQPTSISCVGYSDVVGREQDKNKILQLLLSDECMKLDVSVINIFAASGVGKTTLVHLVYNDPTVCEAFEIRGWINISEQCDVRWLVRVIIESFTKISCTLTDPSDLQELLKEELKGKRFLLVLDGIQSENENFWDRLLDLLCVAAKGSTIIVTSWNEMAKNIKGLMCSYELKHLSEEDCWRIIRQHAFDGQGTNGYPVLIAYGKLIVSKCEGIPLAAKLLGGLLRSADNEVLWTAVSENSLPALRLSYDLLPHYLLRCFRYCCLFPKDYVFKKDHLVRLWMSQGFIDYREGKNVVDVGNDYFNDLLRRSFFQYSQFGDTREEKFVIHDLVHDLVESVSENEYLRTEVDNLSRMPGKVYHTSFVPQELEMVIQKESFNEPSDLRTFLLINKSVLNCDGSLFHFENPSILNSMFQNFRSLRTLDLSSSNLRELPDSVENLKELCFIALNHTNIRQLPDSMCSLYNLQTLELRDCSHLCELPREAKNLANLQHLDVRNDFGFVSMPPGIGELTNLQTLSTFNVGGEKWHCSIGELMDLVNLRGDLLIGGLENVANGVDAKDANLKKKEYLRTLTLKWSNNNCDLEDDEVAGTAERVLESLEPHSNLEELVIRDYFGDRLPNWMGDSSFSKLISITVDNCYRCELLPPLGQLPSLRYLSVRRMDGVQVIGPGFLSLDSVITNRFPSLERLKLWEMYDWKDWSGEKDGDFPCLRSLSISRCLKLSKVPNLSSLVELSFHYCLQLPVIPSLPSLKSLKIEGLQKLESLTLPKLLELNTLEISCCQQLLSVNLVELASLEQLKINKCPKLHFLPDMQLPIMLQVIIIRGGCPLLRKWCPHGFKERSGDQQVSRRLLRDNC